MFSWKHLIVLEISFRELMSKFHNFVSVKVSQFLSQLSQILWNTYNRRNFILKNYDIFHCLTSLM